VLNKFEQHRDLLPIDTTIHEIVKKSPNAVFLFSKVPAVKECVRIFRLNCEKAEPKPPVFFPAVESFRMVDKL